MSNRRFLARRGLAAALFLLGFATSAPAIFEDGLPPTIDEAHGFLGGTFQRYAVAYAGQDAGHASLVRAASYGGDGCTSVLASGGRRGTHQGRAMKVDWSAISAVEQPDENTVDLLAVGTRGNVRVYFPDERAARSAAHAFEVLRGACAPSALTARR